MMPKTPALTPMPSVRTATADRVKPGMLEEQASAVSKILPDGPHSGTDGLSLRNVPLHAGSKDRSKSMHVRRGTACHHPSNSLRADAEHDDRAGGVLALPRQPALSLRCAAGRSDPADDQHRPRLACLAERAGPTHKNERMRFEQPR